MPRVSGRPVECACFTPLHYEPNYAYPLIIWLHGPDDDEGQLLEVMPYLSTRNYVAIAPRSPRCLDGATCWPRDPQGLAEAERVVFSALEQATRRYHIARHRVFLAGYLDGGTMALRTALTHPDRFAGSVSLGGAFPRGAAPLSRLTSARDLPLFLAVGRESESYPDARVCEDLRLLYAAGLQSVTLRQYHPCADELLVYQLQDLNRWLMSIVTDQELPSPSTFDLD